MIRRDFMRRLTLTVAGLLVADDVLDTLVHGRSMVGWTRAVEPGWISLPTNDAYAEMLRMWVRMQDEQLRLMRSLSTGPVTGQPFVVSL